MNRRKLFSVAAGLALAPALAETPIGPQFKYLPGQTANADYIQLQRWFEWHTENARAWSIQTSSAGLIGIKPESLHRLKKAEIRLSPKEWNDAIKILGNRS